MNALVYGLMLLFDFAILAGAAWLMNNHGWPNGVFVAAVVMVLCNNPSSLIAKEKA